MVKSVDLFCSKVLRIARADVTAFGIAISGFSSLYAKRMCHLIGLYPRQEGFQNEKMLRKAAAHRPTCLTGLFAVCDILAVLGFLPASFLTLP